MIWDAIVLGIVQGFFEWLPVSSKSILMLLSTLFLSYTIQQSYVIAIALHGGVVASAILYFHRYLKNILKHRNVFYFLVVATIITSVIGIPLYLVVNKYLIQQLDLGSSALLIGLLLLIQILIRGFTKGKRSRGIEGVTLLDAAIFGVVQGLSVLPGVSRSGVTVLALLYLGYSIEESLKLSFLSSIPVNMGAVVVPLLFSRGELSMISIEYFILALIASAATGLATIRFLIKIASKHGISTQLLMACITLLIGATYIFTK